MTTHWRAAAACAGADPVKFEEPNAVETPFQRYDRMQSAFRVCASCPVMADCLAEGQRNQENGIWGGVLLTSGQQDRRTGWSRQTSTRQLVPCGTESAYVRHRRRKEQPDAECMRAHAAYVNSSRARRAARPTPSAEPDDIEQMLFRRYTQEAAAA